MQWIYAITDLLAALADLLDEFDAAMGRLAALAIVLVWILKRLVAILPLFKKYESVTRRYDLAVAKKNLVLCPVGTTLFLKKPRVSPIW